VKSQLGFVDLRRAIPTIEGVALWHNERVREDSLMVNVLIDQC
jgi:hypothetical protein